MLSSYPLGLTPLAGVKLVSLAINIPGPVAAARLRDLGASVTKFEPPDGDPLERGCPAWYGALHQGVTVRRLDLKDPPSRESLFALLQDADLLLTSSRPISLDRLGLAWNEMHPRFPHLCHLAIIGHEPPDENRSGHDLTYQAALGLLSPPQLPRALLADLGGAEEATAAALALLLARERGQGALQTHVSLAEAARRFALPHQYGLTAATGPLGGGWPTYNIYEAARGWVAVAAIEPHFAERLARELQMEAPSHERLTAAFRSRTADEWERWGAERDLPIAAIRASI